ncbi:MAG: HPr family phosphocarrier protein [Clostridiales bacterium]|nr:HPr family phosphocarrier protein [Clostridiales bacterium]
MVSKKVNVTNPEGLHMRPAGIFTKEMSKFESDVNIAFNGKDYNGKSIMNVIAACIKCGSEIEISCSGSDEEAALQKAVELVQA